MPCTCGFVRFDIDSGKYRHTCSFYPNTDSLTNFLISSFSYREVWRMRMTVGQKIRTVFGVFSARSDIKRLLVRRYWERHKFFILDFAEVHAVYSTGDFYSNYWFWGPQNEERVYEPAITQLLVDRLNGSRGFVDVGANLGYFTVIASVILKEAPLFAFEMDATLTPLIELNLKLNGNKSAKVVSAAVGDNNGAPVNYSPHAFKFVEPVTGLRTEPFQVQLTATTVTLDTYFSNMSVLPNFMKVDVDGAEMAVLKGMSRFLEQPDFEMLLEIHSHHLPQFGSSADEVLNFLYTHGFKTYFVTNFRNEYGRLSEIRDARDLTAQTGDMVLVTRTLI